jgi:gluconokinase
MTATWPRIVVMGVSGSGKSTVAARLGAELGLPFAEGDDFHSDANRAKMTAGIALTDEDRRPWLASLRDWAASATGGCVISCSALRRAYRDVLREAGPDVVFVEIDVPPDVLRARMAARSSHYMPTLEPLADDEPGARVDGSRSIDEVVRDALAVVRSSADLPRA